MNSNKIKVDGSGSLKKRFFACWELYVFLLPAILLTILFRYVPLYGLQMAFKELVPGKTIAESPWVGLQHFERFFSMPNSGKIIWNTFKVAFLNNLIQFPLSIIFALMLNQVRNEKGKKIVQNISYMPHLLSAVIAISIATILLAPNTGIVNILIKKFGGEQILFFGKDKYVIPIYVITGVWQNMGYNAIIYLAALAAIDQEQYEAAKIDGANRLNIIRHIELPAIADTIIIMLILSMGLMFAVGAEKMLLIQTPLNLGASEIISTYVYKVGIMQAQFGFSTAVDLFNTLVNLACLLIVNGLSRKFTDNSVF